MFENIAAIDIGTSSIKIVTVKTGFRDFQVLNFLYEDIDQSIEHSDETMVEILSRIVNENKLHGYTILTNLPMENTIIRNLTFPFNEIEKIAEAIPFEAEEKIPYKLDDIVLDFQPIKTHDTSEGRVLLAAAQKETISNHLDNFKKTGISPVMMGIESRGLYECYRYFSTIGDETVIQLDIGNNKTVINIIENNNLLYTRSIIIGVNLMHKCVSDVLNIPLPEAVHIFENLNLDLTSFENNLQRENHNKLNIKKSELKKIYTKVIDIVDELVEHVFLTRKAFSVEMAGIEFNRILLSGGGANISGIGLILSTELELPVVSLPFLQDYREARIQTQFPIAFGTVLSFLNKKDPAITFLKNEFLPETSMTLRKKYYLSAAFVSLSIIILIINIISTAYLKSESNAEYNDILKNKYQRYFHSREIPDDPIKEAGNMLKEEKKEFENIDTLIRSNDKFLDILNDIISFFPQAENFELGNLVINEKIIRLDGSTGSSRSIDEFKNKLIESNKFDSVTLNTNIKKTDNVGFSMTIKLKILDEDQSSLVKRKDGEK